MIPSQRVLLAWELGGGYGHLQTLLPVADALASHGLTPILSAQDPVAARAVMAGSSHLVLAAPSLPHATAPLRIENWADLAAGAGYATPDTAAPRIRQWLALIDEHQIAAVLAEFAPGAMLAARIAGLPCLAIGAGWNTPPPTTPLAPIRFWQTADPADARAADARLLAALNPALAMCDGAPLPNLAALFPVECACVASFPELDHYPGRDPAACIGPIFAAATGAAPAWPLNAGPRVFAYLRAGHPTLPALLQALSATGCNTVMHLRGGPVPTELPPNVQLSSAPVRLDATLPDCAFVICQGLNTMSAALLFGCPVLALPEHLEQTVLANRLLGQGLGHALHPKATAADAVDALDQMLRAPCRSAATAFTAHYRGYTPSFAINTIVDEVIGLLPGPIG